MIRGYIRDREGKSIANALVILNANAYIADKKGIIEVPRGEYTATVMHKEYQTQRSRIHLERDFIIVMEKEKYD